jgi:IS6 family transposase
LPWAACRPLWGVTPRCPSCSSRALKKDGRAPFGGQRFRCRTCARACRDRSGTPFAGHRWPRDVILTAGRWSRRFRLSLADVSALLAERGLDVSRRTILSWGHKFGPLLAAPGRRAARPVRRRWFCDETYVRVAGAWAYVYRAVDEHGQVVDVRLRARRDLASDRAFCAQARRRRRCTPDHVVSDKHLAYVRAVRRRARRAVHTRTGLHRARGETTKPIERAHVPIKDRLRPMRGLQSIASGQRLLEGIEAVQAIRRGDLRAAQGAPPGGMRGAAQTRGAVASLHQLASGLRVAA